MDNPKKGVPIAETNPTLEMAAMEIKAILERYDIAGIVLMHVPGFIKYVMHIDATFSVVSVNAVNQLKITPPIEDPLNPEPAKKKIADTVNMLANLRVYTGKLSMTLTQAEIATRQQFGINAPKPAPGPPNLIPGKNGRRIS
jgi:hypothetical protein